jgi:hypothetical protein
MTNQEILDNAPEGATHYSQGIHYLALNSRGTWMRYDPNGFDNAKWFKADHYPLHYFDKNFRSLADIKRIAELEKERETQEQALKELLYCCDGLSTEYAERNYGDAEIWARHIHESYVKYQELQEQGE